MIYQPMNPDPWPGVVTLLKNAAVSFVNGLTDAEVNDVETRFGFQFPPDLRALLQIALPSGSHFPNWRSGSESTLREWLNLPRRGVLFDIEHNGFWLEEWGLKPPAVSEQLQVADRLLAAAPRLIPVFAHRMIPEEPHLEGNPIFSVHQTDIIYYGYDLEDYLRHEFNLPDRRDWPEHIRAIRFWDLDRFQTVRWAHGSCAFDNRGITDTEGSGS